MADVVLDSLWKVYADGTVGVSDLNLSIGDGEFMVLVGPSGSGKSTALRMVAGLEDLSSGEIRIGQRVVSTAPPKDRDVAMVFQSYALYPHLTVAENIGFGLKLRKVPKDEIRRRVEDAARILGLSEFLEKKPRNLSGGQRQRVAMGRAIVREPQAFLMDEPLSNLDAKLRVQMRSEILRIQRNLGVTTIYVTHDQVEAMTMGDRVAVLRRGALQQVDPPQVLYDRPVNLFVAGFIGSPAMNMVESTVERNNGAMGVRFGGNRLPIDDAVLAARPALASYEGRRVVMGIRPEDLSDAAMANGVPQDRRIKATVDLAEALGSEVIVHFAVDAPPVLTEDTRELAGDVGTEALAQLEQQAQESSADFVARFDPRTRARDGERIEIAVDVSRLHFFDLETGASIWDTEPE